MSNLRTGPSGQPLPGENDGDILIWNEAAQVWVPGPNAGADLTGDCNGPADSNTVNGLSGTDADNTPLGDLANGTLQPLPIARQASDGPIETVSLDSLLTSGMIRQSIGAGLSVSQAPAAMPAGFTLIHSSLDVSFGKARTAGNGILISASINFNFTVQASSAWVGATLAVDSTVITNVFMHTGDADESVPLARSISMTMFVGDGALPTPAPHQFELQWRGSGTVGIDITNNGQDSGGAGFLVHELVA